MPNPKTKLGSFTLATACLLALGSVAVFAQRHFMAAAVLRPEVKVELAAVVERDNGVVPVEKVKLVKQGETLDWTIKSRKLWPGTRRGLQGCGPHSRGNQLRRGQRQSRRFSQGCVQPRRRQVVFSHRRRLKKSRLMARSRKSPRRSACIPTSAMNGPILWLLVVTFPLLTKCA